MKKNEGDGEGDHDEEGGDAGDGGEGVAEGKEASTRGVQERPGGLPDTPKDPAGVGSASQPSHPVGQEKEAGSGGRKATEEEELAKRFERLKELR